MASRPRIVVPAVIALFFGLAIQPAQARQRKHVRPKPAPATQKTEPVAVKPPAPVRPAQQPPTPPQVSYNNGNLLIEARNSTIGDVLNAVKKQTGLPIEITSGNVNERVVGRIGPGPTRNVLTELLNGSQFNYVMLSSPTAPDQVTHVMLSARAAAPAPNQQSMAFQSQAPVYQQPNVYPQPGVMPGNPQAGTPMPPTAEAEGEPEATEEENAESEETQQEVQQPQPPQDGQPETPGVKTPEQLLQQLQQQQQLMLQRQREQSGGPQQQQQPPQQQPQ